VQRAAILFSFFAAAVLSASHGVRAGDPTSGGAPPGYKLVWSDEFDRPGLPDPAKWGYEEGFVRNNEAQYYTKSRLENARVENGMLVIEARKEHFKNPHFKADHGSQADAHRVKEFAEYTSASLITLHKASWKYGRIEVRAKLPHGLGTWPAIWTLGDEAKIGWPRCGEIDIMEFVGHTPGKVFGTVHFQKDGKHKSSGHDMSVTAPWDAFHVYTVQWTPQRMDFYYDQTKYHSFDVAAAENNGQNPFHHSQYLLLNLALGGSWGGKIDDSILPQKYYIDYVRVYQQEPSR
jgi:beta-glucanase (GH16 family)